MPVALGARLGMLHLSALQFFNGDVADHRHVIYSRVGLELGLPPRLRQVAGASP